MRKGGLLLLLLAGNLPAQEQAPEPAPVALKDAPADGEPHHVKCKVGTYWIALPKALDPKAPTRVLFWCHGSNMNGQWYVKGLKALGYGGSDVLVGPNGHNKVRDWVYNFNAPNYDTKLAYGILDDLATRFKLGQVYVGGHSQGAYYTFRIVLSKPEQFAGAIPFAGGLLLGLDPKAAAQRKGKPGPPFAIVHGEMDDVVDPSLSEWAYELFLDASYPAVRFLHPKDHNHWWPGPIGDAIAWTLEVSAQDPAALLASAQRFLDADRGADAFACVARARSLKADPAAAAEIADRIKAKGEEVAKAWVEKMKAKDGAWAEELYDVRERWAGAPEFEPVLRQLETLRKKHVPDASKYNRKAWSHAEKGEDDEARELFEKTVRECFTAFEYVRPAKRWLAKK
jgi:pimeloyl-ACP methyl ester carboxylesterase